MLTEYLFSPIFLELTQCIFCDIFMISYETTDSSIYETSLDDLFNDDLTDIWGQDL